MARLALDLETARVAQLEAQLLLGRARLQASEYSAYGQAELARSQSPPAVAASRTSVSPPRSPHRSRSASPTAALELARLQVRTEELKLEQEKTKLEHARLMGHDGSRTPQASRPLSPAAPDPAPVSQGRADRVNKLVTEYPSFDGTECADTWLHGLQRAFSKRFRRTVGRPCCN